jgi:hypothetical protein
MAVKYIDGSYPNGYLIQNQITTLNLGAAASIGSSGGTYLGSGIANLSGRTTPTIVHNSGTVFGGAIGVQLSGRGTVTNLGAITSFAGYTKGGTLESGIGVSIAGTGNVTNGSATDTTAKIGGGVGVVIGGNGTITNFGTIYSKTISHSHIITNTSVELGGGKVINEIGGDISAGIDITGAGTVINDGTVGADYYSNNSPKVNKNIGAGVTLGRGGEVINGAENDVATIAGGVYARGIGKIFNYGSIGGGLSQHGYRYDGSYHRTPSVNLRAGGTVVNGSASDTGASLSNGVSCARAATVANFGFIGGVKSFSNYGAETTTINSGVIMASGGLVANGAPSDTGARINGVSIKKSIGQINNYGTIGYGYNFKAQGGGTHGFDRWVSTSRSAIAGASLSGGGQVNNGSPSDFAATIYGGVRVAGAGGTVTNFGLIGNGDNIGYEYRAEDGLGFDRTHSTKQLASVILTSGGTVLNGSTSDSSARITTGVSITGSAGTVMNYGAIGHGSFQSTFRFYTSIYELPQVKTVQYQSILLDAGGTVINGSASDTGARIDGGSAGVLIFGTTGKVSNFGTIDTASGPGVSVGVYPGTGGTIVNGSAADAAASISGAIGVALDEPGTVTNYGAISGSQAAVQFYSASDTLVEEGSGILAGQVAGGHGTLILDGKGGTGTLSGLGSAVSGFGTVEVASGAIWLFAGHGVVGSGTVFTNDGRAGVAASDTLTLDSGMTGSGVLAIRAGATAEINGMVSAGESIVFGGAKAELTLDSPGSFLGSISNFSGTPALKLMGFGTGTTFTFTPNGSGTGGTLTVTDNGQQANIALLGQFVATGFHAAISASYTVFTYSSQAAAPHIAPPA